MQFQKVLILVLTIVLHLGADSFQLKTVDQTSRSIEAKISPTLDNGFELESAAVIIDRTTRSLANQLFKNHDKVDRSKTIAIASIVSIDTFKNKTPIGNVISENLIYNLGQYGCKVIDYKTKGRITVTKDGDYVFTRDIRQLKIDPKIDYLLSGTITKYKNGLLINIRIIEIDTNIVIASAQDYMPTEVMYDIRS